MQLDNGGADMLTNPQLAYVLIDWRRNLATDNA